MNGGNQRPTMNIIERFLSLPRPPAHLTPAFKVFEIIRGAAWKAQVGREKLHALVAR
jgi:hypothetical protein